MPQKPSDLTCMERCFQESPVPQNVTQMAQQTFQNVFRSVNSSTNVGRVFDANLFNWYCE